MAHPGRVYSSTLFSLLNAFDFKGCIERERYNGIRDGGWCWRTLRKNGERSDLDRYLFLMFFQNFFEMMAVSYPQLLIMINKRLIYLYD